MTAEECWKKADEAARHNLTLNETERIIHEYGQQEYRRGYSNGWNTGFRKGEAEAARLFDEQ
jgi:flagellar biosynthesis/type III secretory pathway protein FliH